MTRALAPTSNYGIYVDTVERAVQVEPLVVDLITKLPDPILPNKIASVFMMSRSWSERNNAPRPQNTRQREEMHTVRNTNGTGPFGGFVTITRADGVKLALSVTGWATSPQDQEGTSNARFRGTVTVIGGTGPYSRATGTGTMDGYRKAALGSPVELTFSVVVQQR